MKNLSGELRRRNVYYVAIAALQKLLSIPYNGAMAANVLLTPALLRLDPMFDPFRNDPRFQKLIVEAEAAMKAPAKP